MKNSLSLPTVGVKNSLSLAMVGVKNSLRLHGTLKHNRCWGLSSAYILIHEKKGLDNQPPLPPAQPIIVPTKRPGVYYSVYGNLYDLSDLDI